MNDSKNQVRESAAAFNSAVKARIENPLSDDQLRNRLDGLPCDFELGPHSHAQLHDIVYGHLFSALSFSVNHERFPGAKARQKALTNLVKEYQHTLDCIKRRST